MGQPRLLNDLNCAVCGTLFRPKAALQKCCSQACGHIFKRTRKPQPCTQCGLLFIRKESTQKLCSRECVIASFTKKRTVSCAVCGTDFVRPHGKQRTYCSVKCAAKDRSFTARSTIKPVGSIRRVGGGYIAEKLGDGKWVLQHRHRMGETLRRPLLPHERVHHKNGVRDDNRPANLELWTTQHKDPPGVRTLDKAVHAFEALSASDRQRFLERLAGPK